MALSDKSKENPAISWTILLISLGLLYLYFVVDSKNINITLSWFECVMIILFETLSCQSLF